jgi:N6-L-threonylcarbamoyladenine synthase
MKILAIETSCDETGVAYIEVKDSKAVRVKLLGESLASQIKVHQAFGGVFPAVARREHAKIIGPLIKETLTQAKAYKKIKNVPDTKTQQTIRKILMREEVVYDFFESELYNIKKPAIDCIAVTIGPGLEPALWVGISTARALGTLWNIPVIPINHMEGHIVSVLVSKEEMKTSKGSLYDIASYPVLSLLVSGGHTELVLTKKPGSYTVLGSTRDDAAGEAFDKCARMLELPYPGGPEIAKRAAIARNKKIKSLFTLPRPMIHTKDFDFSYSGLKTALLYALRDMKRKPTEPEVLGIAREVEDAIVEVLVHKTIQALEKTKANTIIIGGGVACNTYLKDLLTETIHKKIGTHIIIKFPDKTLSTDNALMIALAGYETIRNGKIKKRYTWKAQGNLGL